MDDFFTVASLTTFAGSVAAVVVVANTLRHALHWGPRWFVLLLAIACSLIALMISGGIGAQSQTTDMGSLRYVIALVNGCLIYTSAFGIQNTVIAERAVAELKPKGGIEYQGPPAVTKVAFRSPW